MRYTVQGKALCLLSIVLVHVAFGSPIIKRDVLAIGGDERYVRAVADPEQISLSDADVFGGVTRENGAREKRLLKLKALGLGAGLKAAHAGLKTVGVLGAKAVGKTAVKAATTVGLKVAKAAITLGIAKVLLSLVFGKINQLIDFKTRLLGNAGGGGGILSSSSSLSGGSGGVGASASVTADAGGGVSASVDASAGTDDTDETGGLPKINADNVSLAVPNEFITGGFNVVNRAAPVVGEVIQRTAERLLRLSSSFKPILGSSLGFKASAKREATTGQEQQQQQRTAPNEESKGSSLDNVLMEPSSQFSRRSSVVRYS